MSKFIRYPTLSKKLKSNNHIPFSYSSIQYTEEYISNNPNSSENLVREFAIITNSLYALAAEVVIETIEGKLQQQYTTKDGFIFDNYLKDLESGFKSQTKKYIKTYNKILHYHKNHKNRPLPRLKVQRSLKVDIKHINYYGSVDSQKNFSIYDKQQVFYHLLLSLRYTLTLLFYNLIRNNNVSRRRKYIDRIGLYFSLLSIYISNYIIHSPRKVLSNKTSYSYLKYALDASSNDSYENSNKQYPNILPAMKCVILANKTYQLILNNTPFSKKSRFYAKKYNLKPRNIINLNL